MLFHAQTYSDPIRVSDSHYLPDMVVKSENGSSWDATCELPGCMPDSEPVSFPSPMQAFKYAWEGASGEMDWGFAFRFAYCGAINRLRGNIAMALVDEKRFQDLRYAGDDGSDSDNDAIDAAFDHIEEAAKEAARATYSVKG